VTEVGESELRAAIEAVEDPRLLHRVGELGMLRELRVKRRSAAAVVAVPTAGYGAAAAEELGRRVLAAGEDAGFSDLDVEIALMSDEEIAELTGHLAELGHPPRPAGTAAPAEVEQGTVRGPGRANPFMEKASTTRVLGISSGKGGVGKSSITVNLAVTLAAMGYKAALLDADVYGFSVPRMMGVSEGALVLEQTVVPPVAHGVRCVSMGLFVDEEQAVVWRGPMLHKALEQFLVDVHWGNPDFLVVDMPPGTGDVALSMAQFLPRAEIFVVTTPQPAAQRVAMRSAVMARQLKLPVRGVIENMSFFVGDDGTRYELFGRGGGQALADALGVGLLAQIPLVPSLREGGDEGVPVTVAEPSGQVAEAFHGLAETIVAMGPARVYRRELSVT
jgi:ATP-binding protein involved in chromosome partitioning